MEQWLPLTELVPYRHKKRNWKKLIILGAVSPVLAAFLAFFGRRSQTGGGRVRSAAIPRTERIGRRVVRCAPAEYRREVCTILADGGRPDCPYCPSSAEVVVARGVDRGRQGNGQKAWRVKLTFNPLRSEWSASDVQMVTE
jgi:hypothetical protein